MSGAVESGGGAPSKVQDARTAAAGADGFSPFAARVRERVERALRALLDLRVDAAREQGEAVEAAVAAVRDLSMRGGKRMRAAMLAAAYEACGGAGGADTVALAGVCLELLQTYLLVHDDWMDRDDVRRGGPSVHVALTARFGDPHLGAAAAVLAGDFACGLAQEALLSVPVAAHRVRAAAEELARMQQDVVAGQLLDIRTGAEDLAAVERVHDLKTGSYTVRGPLAIGAALAGATAPQREALARYARPLGVAFQLRDDVLGAFGDPSVTGKAVGADLRQGKRTALVVELEEDASARPLLARVLGNADATPADVDAVLRRMESSGARARVEARIAARVESAEAALAGAPLLPRGRVLLLGAALALTRRER